MMNASFAGMFPTSAHRARRAAIAAPSDDAPADDATAAAMVDALEALSANDPKKAAAILAAAIKGTYEAEGNGGEIPPVEDMEAEGIPKALAHDIDGQAQTNPSLARNSLKHARARLGIAANPYAPDMARARTAAGGNPWLPHGGREGAK